MSPPAQTREVRMKRAAFAVVFFALAAAAAVAAPPPAPFPLPTATPESQGMSAARLERLHAGVKRFVDDGKHAGAVWLIARNGRLVDFGATGRRDLEAGLPMEKDTIVRVYSMSKIATSVAALVLLEEARFRLPDPVGDYLPELARMKVFTGGTAEKPLLADAKKAITIEHLFTHTSGLSYDFGDSPVEKLNHDAKLWESASLDEFVRRVAALPLAHEPGERFTYGVSTDVLGALVEKLSGQPLAVFMQERVFGPLGMKDTGFSVPEAKRGRLAKIYETGPDGKLRPAQAVINADLAPKLASGGGGLFSTAADYARLMQMLLNGGQLEGARILSRKTVELMTANHLERPEQAFQGFGLGGSVRLDLAGADRLGSVGEFGWDGAATTYARIDPKERLVTLLLVQHFPFDRHQIFWRFSTLAYQAIID
jgi:CubicO group peptidase (beta-lactamase class C family)